MDQNIDGRVVDALDKHLPNVERYIRSLVRDADEAADISQETSLRLLLTARATGLPDNPGAWMKRVAYNLVVSAARRRQTAVKNAEYLVNRGTAPSLDQTLLEREQSELVHNVLATTRATDRDAMVMAASGYGTRAIAAHLGRSEPATRTLLCRA
ncbi:MAG: hypothetical protein M3Q66_10730, partial [Chloroflexota bacterium]|nr:hypothetical protein [Chloroflexota bacterium]